MRTVFYYAGKVSGFLRRPYAAKLLKMERKRIRKLPSEKYSVEDEQNAAHLAVEWLMMARTHTPDGGFPTYDMASGFGSSYPETTGYILDTLLQYDDMFSGKIFQSDLNQICDFLLSIQHPGGGWQSGYVDENKPPVAFNTAQVMRGLITYYRRFPNEKVATALDKASDWLSKVQESDGSWSKHNYMGEARVYDTYVSAPLVKWAILRNNASWKQAAERNIAWVLTNQMENGWFQNADNTVKHNHRPILHTIAYTIDGLLEYAQHTGDTNAKVSGEKAALALAEYVLNFNYVGGRFDENWQASEATILTGCAQMCIAWAKMPDSEQAQLARKKLKALLLHCQWKDKAPMEMRGAVCGSFPFWGKYEPFRCPNWAVKYCIDAWLNF